MDQKVWKKLMMKTALQGVQCHVSSAFVTQTRICEQKIKIKQECIKQMGW